MMVLTRKLLDAEEIRFSSTFVTHFKGNNIPKIKKLLETQLNNYERHISVSKGLHSANQIIVSGKGENKKDRDDLAVALQKAIYSKSKYVYSRKE